MKNIKDKDSEEYKKQRSIVLKSSSQLSSKIEEAKKIEEQAKNTIAIVRMGLQRNIDNLTQKILEIQNSKKDLEEEIKTLQTEKDKYEKAIEQCATDSRIPEDKRELVAKKASEKVQELKDEIDLKKAKVIYISVDVPEYIEQLNEMQYNLQYIDYDKIGEYKPKETSKDEKDEQQEENSSDNTTTQRQPETIDEERATEKRAEQEEQAGREPEQEEQAGRQPEQEEQARRKAEQEEQARRKAEQEEQARRKAEQEEQARRKPEQEEQTEEQIEDKKPIIYIGEANGHISYSKEAVDDDVRYATIKQAKSEKRKKYNRLNVKGICKEIAGKRIPSVVLLCKINPSIIKALESEPEMVYAYIQSIYNKEPLPFKLIHNLEGRSMIQRVFAMRYTISEKRSGALIKTAKELTEGRNKKTNKQGEALKAYVDEGKDIKNLDKKGLFTKNEETEKNKKKSKLADKVKYGRQDGTIEKDAKKAAAETKQEKSERYSNMEIIE